MGDLEMVTLKIAEPSVASLAPSRA
jgi:hypothetical protein